jgi:hypothetical protein
MTLGVTAAAIASGDRGRFVLVRRLLFALVLLGTAGLIAELFLMEHFEEWEQAIPLVVLGAGLLASVAVAVRPSRALVLAFAALMGAFILTGLVGLWLHYRGNAEFELEIAPAARGAPLVWKALRGAVPVLAPGAMVQLGLLGVIWASVHPARRGVPMSAEESLR